MSQVNVHRQIVDLVRKAAALARTIGISNILQPGLIKEMIIADTLGHELITAKHEPDARDPQDHSTLYEYLSCQEGGSGQMDRMFKQPHAKRQQSLERIRRNAKLYIVIFCGDDPTTVKTIYEIEPASALQEAERQLDNSKNEISHVSFPESWAKSNGRVVFDDSQSDHPSASK